jgi:hypothetical protein
MRRILPVLLFAGLVFLPACHRTPLHARVDAALAPLLPGDTVAVACLRLDRMKDTPFYTKYVANKRIKALEDFSQKTGLDLRESVWELVFTTNGKTRYVFIRGKFGGDFGFEPEFKGPDLSKTSYKGRYLIYTGDSGVVFMNTSAAVAGKVDDLKALVDGFDNPARGAPQAVLDLAGTLPGTAQFWAVSTQPTALIPLGDDTQGMKGGDAMAHNLMRAARSVSQFKMWGDLSRGLEMHVQAVAGNETDAIALRDAFKAAVGMARFATKDSQPETLKLYDGLIGSADGPIVRIDVNEPFELLDSFLSKMRIPEAVGTK